MSALSNVTVYSGEVKEDFPALTVREGKMLSLGNFSISSFALRFFSKNFTDFLDDEITFCIHKNSETPENENKDGGKSD